MEEPVTTAFRQAAQTFFAELVRDQDRPRPFAEHEIDNQITVADERIAELDAMLKLNNFSERPSGMDRLLELAGLRLSDLSEEDVFRLRQLAVSVERDFTRFFIHQLTFPREAFQPLDPVLGHAKLPIAVAAPQAHRPVSTSPLLGKHVAAFLERKDAHGVGYSQHDEIARGLRWFVEMVGQDVPIADISKEQVVAFRDGLQRLDKEERGKPTPFLARQTTDKARQISVRTARRYWSSTKAFFQWFGELSVADPSQGVMAPNGPKKPLRVPPPFSRDELQQLFKTPVFAGHKSRLKPEAPGEEQSRGSLFWSKLIGLYTGMRAGEIAQLETADYVFDAEVPHIRVRLENEAGEQTKSAKTHASIREVPISPVLLALGLRQFVEGRAKRWKDRGRVMREIPLGPKGRKSDGLTKAWGRILRRHGLHQPGRSTHVWRHTVTHALREVGYTDEQIGQVLGHKPTTVTGGYGGQNSLKLKLKVIEKIDYGFDVVEALGGPYVHENHWA